MKVYLLRKHVPIGTIVHGVSLVFLSTKAVSNIKALRNPRLTEILFF